MAKSKTTKKAAPKKASVTVIDLNGGKQEKVAVTAPKPAVEAKKPVKKVDPHTPEIKALYAVLAGLESMNIQHEGKKISHGRACACIAQAIANLKTI